MRNYIICTDSGCDISPQLLDEWGIRCCPLKFRFDGDNTEYSNDDIDVKTFYNRMRDGAIAKTAAVNSETFVAEFERLLQAGCDILYLGFSSGLSATYTASYIAAEQLCEKYPDRKVITVDTLSASAGQGLVVYLTMQKKNEGATIEEAAAFAESIKPKLCHWVTVDDLVYLKRGGRISPTLAFVGQTLGLKPIIHIDNDGKLVNISKIRGRKSAIVMLADKYGELAENANGGTVFISHGDCKEDAESLASILNERYGVKVELITYIGTVIGAHAGPGTLALFFLGKER